MGARRSTSSSPSFVLGVSLKMYFGHQQTLDWAEQVAMLARRHEAVTSGVTQLFVLPSAPSLLPVLERLTPAGVAVGAQNLSTEDGGPFTGEISGAVLAEIGCRLVEVGHVERRRLFGETDEVVARKTAAALRNGLTPVICVGESDRVDARAAMAECVRQLVSALAAATEYEGGAPVVVAYEPQWAVGAEAPAPVAHIRAVTGALQEHLETHLDFPGSRVVYGGTAGPGLLSELGSSTSGLFLGRLVHDPRNLQRILDETSLLGPAPSAAASGPAQDPARDGRGRRRKEQA